MNEKLITLTLNGENISFLARPDETLLDVLRNRLDLTGTKPCCRSGDCGACTVIMNGVAVDSCLVLIGKAAGATIQTIEGVEGENGELHPIQQAMVKHEAVQCGYCFPGMVMSAKALLDANPEPTREEIRRALAGNICRCTGYQFIEDAVADAAVHMHTCHCEEGG